MGYFEGFLIPLRQHRLFGGKQVTTAVLRWSARQEEGATWRPDSQGDEKIASPSGCMVVTSSTATRTAWRSASAASCAPVSALPSASTCAAPTTTPRTPRRRASASVGSTRSTTCAVFTATCVSRRARPRPSPSRRCSSSRSRDRQDAIYTKSELVVDDAGQAKRLPWEDWRDGEDDQTSGWMRATSPSGDATFEGEVGWSNELGYGLRAPNPSRPSETPMIPIGINGDRPVKVVKR